MPDYQLVESFDIDDGALAGLSVEECFVLGVEWAEARQRIVAGERFVALCHTTNAVRIAALAERKGRFVEHHECSAGWSQVIIGGPRKST